VHVDPVAKTRRQIPRRITGPVTINHGLNEQTVVTGGDALRADRAR
jgi:hypothetical protein